MTDDYRELPERVAASIALLIDAERKAQEHAPYCSECRAHRTLRTIEAERRLLRAVRDEYFHELDGLVVADELPESCAVLERKHADEETTGSS
jgi:hypothetical protein